MNSNSANVGVNPTINSNDATNSHNLTKSKDRHTNNSDNINTRNIVFNTFLNNEVVTYGVIEENLQNAIVTGPSDIGYLRSPNDVNLDNNARWNHNTQNNAPQNVS